MGELWRSEEMQLVQLYIQIEAAHDIVDEMGKLGLVEFKDLNPHVNAFQRNFINEVKRADEMERKLRFFTKEIEDHNKQEAVAGKKIVLAESNEAAMSKYHLDDLEPKLDEYEKQILELNTHQEALHRNRNQLVELRHVLEKDDTFFSQAGQREEEYSIDEESITAKGLGFISGVIVRDKFSLFERVLFRAARGNIFMKFAEIHEDIEDPLETGKFVKKNVFIVFFHGTALQTKIKKICESFFANLYPCPETPQERKNLLEQVSTRLEDLRLLLTRGENQKCQILGTIALSLNSWTQKVKQEKGIYHTMNKFNYDLGRKCLIAEGWMPRNCINDVMTRIRRANERSGSQVPPVMNPIEAKDVPPTYFKTNKFTSAFQGMIDSYGIARYREINPAVFTIVTFPWEFGIMFGDLGHGFLLLLFALALIYKEKDWEGKKINEMIEMFYGGRYLILLMSLFAMYQGALYNEFFALPMNFGSAWNWTGSGVNQTNSTFARINPDPSHTYVFGVDPVWKGATNELLFYNNMKMKISVILGVLQMTLGLFLHLLNSLHFHHMYDVWFEFLPRVIFLWCVFGYLGIIIVYKWCIDWMGRDEYNRAVDLYLTQHPTENATYHHMRGSNEAPGLLNQLIFMALPTPPDQENALYPVQFWLQKVLLATAGICVPTMMCAKPYFLYRDHKKHKSDYSRVAQSPETQENEPILGESGGHDHQHGHGHEEFELSEIMVHQGLETIEFVLGSVSHTASYLRLWALSLAHSELATVFWDKAIFMLSIQMPIESLHQGFFVTGIFFFILYSAWFFGTLLVLLFMEGLSAFLHALRLHWVEFQSKFYKGDGRQFLPFSYAKLMTDEK